MTYSGVVGCTVGTVREEPTERRDVTEAAERREEMRQRRPRDKCYLLDRTHVELQTDNINHELCHL
jgi:hypothetical protein